MMKISVSIVSHGHQERLARSGLIAKLDGLEVHLRENQPRAGRQIFGPVIYEQNLRACRLGENHNHNFEAANPADDDWFVLLNPDVDTDRGTLEKLVRAGDAEDERLLLPELWNPRKNVFDHNARPAVTLHTQALAFAGLERGSRYTMRELAQLRHPAWGSGAFLAIKARLFRALGGFDPGYFMYMEDVDFCLRARRLGVRPRFYRNVRVLHDAARDSRRLLSRNFRYHIESVARFYTRQALGKI